MDSLQYAREVAQLLATNVQRCWEFGYHGTSAEAIVKLARTGGMPTGGTSGTELYVYTAVRDGKWVHQAAESEAKQEATGTASWVHAAAAKLQRTPQEILHAEAKFTNDEIRDLNLGDLPAEEDVRAVREETRRLGREGVLLAVTAKARCQMGLPQGWEPKDSCPGEACFNSPGGLRINQIQRISPLSATDRDFIIQALE